MSLALYTPVALGEGAEVSGVALISYVEPLFNATFIQVGSPSLIKFTTVKVREPHHVGLAGSRVELNESPTSSNSDLPAAPPSAATMLLIVGDESVAVRHGSTTLTVKAYEPIDLTGSETVGFRVINYDSSV